jgi:hypothetical protein
VFEDVENEALTDNADDRVIVYAIWARDITGKMPAARGWEILSQRYPEDARFLLLHVYEEHADRPADWTPSTFLDDVQRILDRAGGRLHPEVRDLLAVAEDDLHPLQEPDISKLTLIRSRVGIRTGVPDAARKRMARLRTDVVRELHDLTQGKRSIGTREKAATSPEAWKEAIATAAGPKKTYAVTERLTSGDLVEHPKFGVGVVTATEPGRAHVLFESGVRKLVTG